MIVLRAVTRGFEIREPIEFIRPDGKPFPQRGRRLDGRQIPSLSGRNRLHARRLTQPVFHPRFGGVAEERVAAEKLNNVAMAGARLPLISLRKSPGNGSKPAPGSAQCQTSARNNQFHAGLDFPAPTGTAITAAASGRAIFSGYDDGWGLTVVLDHGNGLHTRYAHLSSAAVSVGASVASGALVGRVGSTGFATGPHLHFEVTVRGANADPGVALGLY